MTQTTSRQDSGPQPPLSLAAILVLILSVGIGAVLSVTAAPESAAAIAAACSIQLAASLSALRLWGRPLWWSICVGAATVLSALLDPRLGALIAEGTMPWFPLATVLGSAALFRWSTSWRVLLAGTVALGVGTAIIVTASVGAGYALTTTALSAATPYLAGALIVSTQQLRRARAVWSHHLSANQNVRTVERDQTASERALAEIAVRADVARRSRRSEAPAQAIEDISELAREALGGSTASKSPLRIEVSPKPADANGPGEREPALPQFSERERAVLQLLAVGSTNRVIAEDLYLSEAAVKQQVSRLMKRFGAENRTQLAVDAVKWFPNSGSSAPVD